MKEICTLLVKLYIICSRMQRVDLHARPSIIQVGCPTCCYQVCALDHERGVLQTWITIQRTVVVMQWIDDYIGVAPRGHSWVIVWCGDNVILTCRVTIIAMVKNWNMIISFLQSLSFKAESFNIAKKRSTSQKSAFKFLLYISSFLFQIFRSSLVTGFVTRVMYDMNGLNVGIVIDLRRL